ncbi:MAG: four helix bundle protein [Balneolales bacterium]|nr:four helix bundle protein [Balneolales bacterium]
MISQMRRCSISVPSNIAEGAGRSSLYELQTQLIISKNLKLLEHVDFIELEKEIIEIQKMIYTYAQRFR